MSKYDHYSVAKEISTALAEQGATKWSQRIDEAISGGFTGTEILMRLRCSLLGLLQSNDEVDSEIVKSAKELISEIDQALV